ncbi:ATP-binding protein [Variovorax sp. J22P168]|uniref:ATP-binding protein n=1 Tax=Variovorax jilinensis TaxID=3053513 RepID=UPI0025784345|nr:ATP-binding protein [Variovorax sp. J22P168]MDM0014577.1 ATP-binding protein [Variovorax sp. J22P168]
MSRREALAPAPPDLSVCDREPIRTPGAIQPHGRLLVLLPGTLSLVAFSENWPEGEERDRAVSALSQFDLAVLEPGASPVLLGMLPVGGRFFDVSAHRSSEHLIFEFEDGSRGGPRDAPIHSLTRVFLPRLQETETIEQLAGLAAVEMKRLTGFGRCLTYRFDAAGHGEVLGEALDAGYDSYAGHRFPASDIPQQARALYLSNRFRLIADAFYEPVPLLAAAPDCVAGGIDLSQAQLRSVSPVHLEYMRNMGTLASASVSIVVDGRLWGLISCHDHAPRLLDSATRLACEHLGQLLALQIQSKAANQLVAERLELRQITLEMVSRLADSDATLQRLVADPAPILRLARATGAAVVLDEAVWSVGEVPAKAQILELAQWISGMGLEVYRSDALASTFAPARAFEDKAAGVLAVSISQVHRHMILWFRPEMVQTVRWAGEPRKAERADGRILPRLSFRSWVEHIGGRSDAWTAAEIGAAGELRQALIGIVLRRAEELAAVATELGRVNKELEAFSYTVSHDLRAPMRHISGYVDLVLAQEGSQLSERARRYLDNVKEASAFAGLLVDALLDFSRMGRASIKRRRVDTSQLVDALVRELVRHEPVREIEWHIAPDLPSLDADPLLLQVALRNLLANALKYSRGRSPARITVRAVHADDGEGIEVEDNGVGFQMSYVDKLFGVFQRLHHVDEFEGTGIGLANVKRIVERHGGRVWARGEPGRGATFGLLLPTAPALGEPVPVHGEDEDA